MRGRDRTEERTSYREELFSEALSACMEEQLSFIPPEREIARMHTFSQEHQKAMEELLRTTGAPKRRTITKREFTYSFNRIAACILVVLVVGGAFAGGMALNSRKNDTAQSPAAADFSADQEAQGSKVTEAEEESAEEVEETAPSQATDGGKMISPQVNFCGQEISLAASQYLPEKLEDVKTLINSPVIGRDAESVLVTIGNMKDRPIYYYVSMDLEVFIDGAWYLIPPKETGEEGELRQMVMLESEMAQDEEISLQNYELDYEAEKYRIVTYLDGLILSSEFRFADLEEDLEAALERKE